MVPHANPESGDRELAGPTSQTGNERSGGPDPPGLKGAGRNGRGGGVPPAEAGHKPYPPPLNLSNLYPGLTVRSGLRII